MNITPTLAPILDCGHTASEHSTFTTGYGTDANGKRHCYDCCQERDTAYMRERGRIDAYLSSDGKTVTGWPGYALLTVTREWITSAGGFAACTPITRVWAADDAGTRWHGRGPGRGMYMRLTRSVDARRAK